MNYATHDLIPLQNLFISSFNGRQKDNIIEQYFSLIVDFMKG
jgi:hypothetical protein